MAHYGDSLKALRRKLGLSQQELADQIDIERTSIAKYEQNGVTPNAYIAYKIAQALGTTVDNMVEGKV